MTRNTRSSFGEVLKELRNRRHLSRPKLALRLHMHPSSIEKWECGDVLPDRARVEELSAALLLSETERLFLLEAYAGHRILPSLHNLPAARNAYFIGREEILQELRQRLAPDGQLHIQAITGLGGIGKTQIALEYVYRYQRDYTHLFWVSADSPETIVSEFGKIARELALPEQNEKDQGKIVQAIQRWLREYVNWLLVLDNIDDLRLVGTFIPAAHLGAVLLTTHRQVTEPVAQALDVDLLSTEEGACLLLRRSRHLSLNVPLAQALPTEIIGARAIVQQLDSLPLALDQAGAYISEVGCSVDDYLVLLSQEQHTLLQRRGNVPADHPQSVALTFALAFEQVQLQNEAASALLKLCALLAPDAIPLELFAQNRTSLSEILATTVASALTLDCALELLQSYSLIRRDSNSRSVSLHRLLQVVLRNTLTAEERDLWQKRAISLLFLCFPEVEPEVFAQCERLTPHVLACAAPERNEQLSATQLAEIVRKAADYLRMRAQYQQAELLYQQAIRLGEQGGSAEYSCLAHAFHNLAVLYGEQGMYERAEPLYQRALHLWEQIQGSEHPLVAHLLTNLAFLFYTQGKYDQTEQLLQRALAIRERTQGPEHPRIVYPLNNLAELYLEQGKYQQAEIFYQRVLYIWRKAGRPEHLDVSATLHGLAALYSRQGMYERAEPLYQQSLRIREQALGPEHPRVMAPLHGLAVLASEQGRYEQAEALFQRVLAIRTRQLGLEHLDTAETWHEFARFREKCGRLEEAATFFRQALAVREHRLGGHHPRTQETRKAYLALLSAPAQTRAAIGRETHLLNETHLAPPDQPGSC